MSDKKTLEDIFNDPDFGLINLKPKHAPAQTENERLNNSFNEINDFYAANGKAPESGGDMQEHTLFARLKALRENVEKRISLKPFDVYGLLNFEEKKIESLEDIFNDADFSLFDDDSEGLFDLKHVKKFDDRASSDFVAKRTVCKNFSEYEDNFKQVQKDLKNGKRKLVTFKQDNLEPENYYVHNGLLLFLKSVDFDSEVKEYKSGSRERKDGRTHTIFENGTESKMLYRSLYKALLDNGKAVTQANVNYNEDFANNFSEVSEDDVNGGFIYVLQSKSEKPEIKSIQNLYKIGFTKQSVEVRIKNAIEQPTYLMADVKIITTFKCYNIDVPKLELLLHNFFGNACLNVNITDKQGNIYSPREWFIAPLEVIEEVIDLIIKGTIINYTYDFASSQIVLK